VLNNETTYSNGEFKWFFKIFINAKSKFSFQQKHIIDCDNWIGNCYTINFERDGKPFKSMIILGSLAWKVGKNLDRPLTYWIGSKWWELYNICKRINWKSILHWDIMCFDTLFQI